MRHITKYIIAAFLIIITGSFCYAGNNYTHTVSTAQYQDLSNPVFINSTDSIAGAYYVNANLLFPAFGGLADFNIHQEVPSLGAYVTRNGYIGVYENPGFNFTDVFHGFLLQGLIKIDETSSMSVQFSGNTGSRILKFQWKNMGIENHPDNEHINFQIWFDEASKSISYHYGPSTAVLLTNEVGVIGVMRAPNDFSYLSHASYLTGDAAKPAELSVSNPGTFSELVGVNNFPPEGTVFTFNMPSTGVYENVQNNFQFDVSPNPFSETFNLSYPGEFLWSITDISGKEIVNGLGNETVNIPASEISHGVYFLKLESGGKSAVKIISK